MHVASTFDGLQAISLIDDNAQDFSEFALDLVLPRDISELEPGNGEGVYLEKFIPDGDPDDMPPYKGVMVCLGYRYDQLSETDLSNGDGYDGAFFFEAYELGSGKPPVYLIEAVVPATMEEGEAVGIDTIYDWLYDTGFRLFQIRGGLGV